MAGYGFAVITPAISIDARETSRICWTAQGNEFVGLTNALTGRALGVYTALRFGP
jgi:hypothetical protein